VNLTPVNTKNITVMVKQVNDILIMQQSIQDDDNLAKLKIAGVVLGIKIGTFRPDTLK
jgi:hypothetical protein